MKTNPKYIISRGADRYDVLRETDNPKIYDVVARCNEVTEAVRIALALELGHERREI